jgi:uncharacterized membrane protein
MDIVTECRRRLALLILIAAIAALCVPTVHADEPGAPAGADHGHHDAHHERHEEQPATFGAALIKWLGKFHPAAANFPVGILVAAAVAELLFLLTGRPIFEGTARVCVWFGAITAVATGLLGWFMGGFTVVDKNWVMTVHRWIGTGSDLTAVLVLALSEASRRPGREATRRWYRAALFAVAVLVLVAGCFGGSLVYGLAHYVWPR